MLYNLLSFGDLSPMPFGAKSVDWWGRRCWGTGSFSLDNFMRDQR